MRRITLFLFVLFLLVSCHREEETIVKLETSQGIIRLKLYSETPLHRKNFLKLVDEGYYNGMLFHRVIREFMIQAGDPSSKQARAGMRLGANGIGYTLKSEIQSPYFHKKGALAAARESDNVNPERKSDGSHFYIVQGKVFTGTEIDTVVQIINNKRYTALFERFQRQRQGEIMKKQAAKDYEGLIKLNEELSVETRKHFKDVELVLTEEQRRAYTTVGGAPQLDGEYSVFGEVTEGIEIVDKIAETVTDDHFRPLQDVIIYKAEREK